MSFTENDGVRLYWEEHGEDRLPPLLLIQGLGYTVDMWHRVLPLLAQDHRVVGFDNRGAGRSDVPPGPYSMRSMAGDARAALDAAGIGRAVVFGVSMGAVIAQELALTYADRVSGLVLGSPACGGPNAVPAEAEVLDILAARAHMNAEEGVRVLVPYIYDPDTPPDVVEADIAIRLRTYPDPAGYSAQLAATLGYETYERIGAISVPTLVIHGASDRLVPPGNGRDVADRVPGAGFVLIENASHIFFSEAPEETARLVAGLTSRASVSTSGASAAGAYAP